MIALFKFDNMIDLITNSSSELFVIKGTMEIAAIIELVNEALNGITTISEFNLDVRVGPNKSSYDIDYDIEYLLRDLGVEDQDKIDNIKTVILANTQRYYAISFDRDWIGSYGTYDFRKKLTDIGFELIDTDY